MKKGIIVVLTVFMAFCFTFINTSCKKSSSDSASVDSVLLLNKFIYDTLITKKSYLWYDEVKSKKNIKPEGYTNGTTYMDSLKYAKLDKWSGVYSKTEYDQYFQGVYYGMGLSYKFDEDNALRVAYVVPSSPADNAGIKRGYKILSIGAYPTYQIFNEGLMDVAEGENKAGVQVKFKMQIYDGTTKEFTVTKAIVNTKTVLSTKVFLVNGRTVGYLMFNSFLSSSKTELEEAFTYFRKNGVVDVVLDLRYNGGGSVGIAQYLACYLDGASLSGKTFATLSFNSYQQKNNEKLLFYNLSGFSLSIDNLIVIATKRTASASELIINGFKPHINTKIIGEDTYGKPTAMTIMEFGNYYVLPVVIKSTNVNGEGDYFNGLTADRYMRDGLDKDFGDENEACLKEALYYLKNKSFSSTVSKKSTRPAYLKGEEPENKLSLTLGAVYDSKQLIRIPKK